MARRNTECFYVPMALKRIRAKSSQNLGGYIFDEIITVANEWMSEWNSCVLYIFLLAQIVEQRSFFPYFFLSPLLRLLPFPPFFFSKATEKQNPSFRLSVGLSLAVSPTLAIEQHCPLVRAYQNVLSSPRASFFVWLCGMYSLLNAVCLSVGLSVYKRSRFDSG